MIEYICLQGTQCSFWTTFKLGAISKVPNSSRSAAVHRKGQEMYETNTKIMGTTQTGRDWKNINHHFLKVLYISAEYW